MYNATTRNDFEQMVQQSLALRLSEMGANQNNALNALNDMDFEDVRKCYSLTDAELKSAFAYLF